MTLVTPSQYVREQYTDHDFPCRLEEKRKAKGHEYYERKKAEKRRLGEAKKTVKLDGKKKQELAKFGYN